MNVMVLYIYSRENNLTVSLLRENTQLFRNYSRHTNRKFEWYQSFVDHKSVFLLYLLTKPFTAVRGYTIWFPTLLFRHQQISKALTKMKLLAREATTNVFRIPWRVGSIQKRERSLSFKSRPLFKSSSTHQSFSTVWIWKINQAYKFFLQNNISKTI